MTTITGTGNNDILISTAEGDELAGGFGNDTYVVDDALDRVVETATVPGSAGEVSVLYLSATIQNSGNPSLSLDGSRVAYTVGDGIFDRSKVFVKNLTDGSLYLASTDASGVEADQDCLFPVLSPDGTRVAFLSKATNLVAGDANAIGYDLFVKDLQTGGIVQWNISDVTGQTANGSLRLERVAFSPDGATIAFASTAGNQDGRTDGSVNDASYSDIFYRSASGLTGRVSMTAAGGFGNGNSYNPVFLPDGIRVAFVSEASNLVEGDTNGNTDIFIKNLQTQEVTRVSTNWEGEQLAGVGGQGHSGGPLFSADGNLMLFASTAGRITESNPVMMGDAPQLYVKNLTTGATRAATTAYWGPVPDGASILDGFDGPQLVGVLGGSYAFSPDGNLVAFWMDLTNNFNAALADPEQMELYVKNLSTGELVRVNADSAGQYYPGGYGENAGLAFTPDGQSLVFVSQANGLMPVFGNNETQIYIKDLFSADAEGLDTVQAGVSFTLPDNVENLTLTGAGNLSGQGNSLNNVLTGNTGDNLLIGGGGDDTLDGGEGSDTVSYENSAAGHQITLPVLGELRYGVTASLQNGVSSWYGVAYNRQEGTDTFINIENLIGTAFIDTLTGSAGDNLLEGLAGDDFLDGLGGSDTVSFSRAAEAVQVNLFMGQSIGGASTGFDLIRHFENVRGSEFSDTVHGNSGANVLDGRGGNDHLYGYSGNDTLIGGEGDDELDGGSGTDVMTGGLGNDTYRIDSLQDVIVENAGEGVDTVETSFSYTLADHLENLSLVGQALTWGTGNAGDNRITGSLGSNILIGLAGNDILDGGAGEDLAYYRDAAAAVTVDLAAGTAVGGVDVGADTLIHIEDVTGSAHDDSLSGDALDNALMGVQGNDILSGAGGDDYLDGGDGNDALDGGDGADRLFGGTGNNTLEGGAGDQDVARYTYALNQLTVLGDETHLIILRPDGGTDNLTGIEWLSVNGFSTTVAVADVINHNPVAVADTNSSDAVVESSYQVGGDSRATGNVLLNDTDADLGKSGVNESLSVIKLGNLTLSGPAILGGTYGSLMLSANGAYAYELNNGDSDTQALANGQTVQDIFSYTVTDTRGATSVATLSIAVQGSTDNNAPVLAQLDAVSVTDTPLYDNFAPLSGQLTAVDPDGGLGLTYGVQAGTVDPLDADYVVADTPYARVRVNIHTGEWTATPDREAVNALGALLDTAITFTVSDGYSTTTASQTLHLQQDGLTESEGDDVLAGSPGNDELHGGSGNDRLDGRGGDDVMDGGAGDDTFMVDSAGDSVLEQPDAVAGGFFRLGNYLSLYSDDFRLQISDDGGHVLITSPEALAPEDTDGLPDMYLLDASSGESTLVDSPLLPAGSGFIGLGYSSGSNRVLFKTDARIDGFTYPNSTPSNVGQLYVKDLDTGEIFLVSGNGNVASDTNETEYEAMSADGRFVVFQSQADNLDGVTTGYAAIFLKDLQTGAITRINTAANGDQGVDAFTWNNGKTDVPYASVSADGTLVAFTSSASNLVAGDTNNSGDIFIKNILTGAIERASTDAAGNQVAGTSLNPLLTPDGNHLVFTAGDINGEMDIFVKNLSTGAVLQLSNAGEEFRFLRMGDDGSSVSFLSNTEGVVEVNLQTGARTVLADFNGIPPNISPIFGIAGGTAIYLIYPQDESSIIPQVVPGVTLSVFDIVVGPTDWTDGSAPTSTGGGVDTVEASVSHTLSANVENLILTGAADLNGTGNDGDNAITGNSGRNVLTGGLGNDTLIGGDGTDTAVFHGLKSAYTITDLGGGNFTVSGADGNDSLSGIEILQFDDAPQALGVVNELPVLAAPAGIVLTDTTAPDTFAPVSGMLSATDADVSDTLTYGVTGGALSGDILTRTGTYGTLSLNRLTGAYTYTVNGAAVEALTADAAEQFTVSVSDGTDTVSQTLNVTVHGVNDVAVLNSVNIDLNETDDTIVAGGTLNVTDPDSTSPGFVVQNDTAGDYGIFSLASDGTWSFTAHQSYDSLTDGDSLIDNFTIVSNNGDSATVTVTLHGVDDAAIISSATVNLTESNVALSASGALTIDDLDGMRFFLSQDNTAGSYGHFSIGDEGAWTYLTDSAVDSLGAGATVSDVFSVSAPDGTTTTVTVNIQGSNDGPTAQDDSNGADAVIEASPFVTGDAAASGNVLTNDTDPDAGDTQTVTALTGGNLGEALTGVYGSLVLNANGSYTYTLDNNDADTEALTTGQSVTDSFSYTMEDGLGASSTATLNILIEGTTDNSAPELAAPTAITYTDTIFNDSFAEITGTLAATDADAGDTLTYGLTGGTDLGGGLFRRTGNYGLLTLNSVTGAYTFVADEAAIEPLGLGATETFTVTVSDGTVSVSQTLLVQVIQSGVTETQGDDLLTGTAGLDAFAGLDGNDTYVVTAGDLITEQADGGLDTVESSAGYTLSAHLENLTLTGALALSGAGNALANTLTGNAAASTLAGGAGDDTYVLGSAANVVSEAAGNGTDRVISGFTTTLRQNVENLTLTGGGHINGTGNVLGNVMTGNSGNNVLNGGGGNDTLAGGLGNDSYEVDSAGDSITEGAGEGTDNVSASINWTLAANIENLNLTGTAAINGTGNELANTLGGNTAANTLIGGLGNDVLNGGGGADTLLGGAGNDTYAVDNAGDVAIEQAGEGTDSVLSGISYTLGSNIEHLTLTNTLSVNGTGNALANTLTGNSGANVLDGGAGNDTLSGGAGNDTLLGGTGNDNLIGGAGNDTYRLARGDGADLLTDNDATSGNSDLLWFNDATIGSTQLWFRKAATDLEVSVIGTTDKVTVKNWYSGVNNQVEQFRAGDGKVLEAAEVANLVNAMASLTPPAVGTTSLSSPAYDSVLSVMAVNWS